MKRNFLILFIWCLVLALILTGCQQAARKPQDNNPPNENQVDITGVEKRILAGQLSNQAQSVEGVKRATIVISETVENPTVSEPSNEKYVALVALTVADNLAGNNVKEEEIKNKVKAKILTNQNKVNNVLITTNPDMIKKINDLAEGIIEGKSVKSYNNEAANLRKELMKQ